MELETTKEPELSEKHIVAFTHSQLNLNPHTTNFEQEFNGLVEKTMLKTLMNYHSGNISAAAHTYGRNRSTLTSRLVKHGLHAINNKNGGI